MAESYFKLLEELYLGLPTKGGKRDQSALFKCAKVRRCHYEMGLWQKYGLRLSEVNSASLIVFEKSFLGGKKISHASDEEIRKAIKALGYAASSTQDRCCKLLKSLNEAMPGKSVFIQEQYIQNYINYVTFSYDVVADREPGYGFEVRVFHDQEHLTECVNVVKKLHRNSLVMCLGDIYNTIKINKPH